MEPNDDTVPLVDLPSARAESSEARTSGESHYLHESVQPESQDAADSTSPPSLAESNLYGPYPKPPQVSAAVESVAEVGSQPAARRRYVRAKLAVLGICLILISITIIFSIWLGNAIKRKVVMNDEGTVISSWSMSQKSAKIIESMWNAVISPVIFFFFDALLFRVARVTMISEKTSRTVALRPLVAASSTDAGTYNPIKIYGIVRKSRLRLLPFAILTVLSGISLGSISNVVAYEAYTKPAGETSVLLQTLNGIESRSTGILPPSQFSTTGQLANFTGQVNGMLTALSYQNAADKLESDSYIGVNATTASLNALSTE